MHESFGATFCAVVASIFDYVKVAILSSFQVQVALSGVTALTAGTHETIRPLTRGLWASAIVQSLILIGFAFGIWGTNDPALKIGAKPDRASPPASGSHLFFVVVVGSISHFYL